LQKREAPRPPDEDMGHPPPAAAAAQGVHWVSVDWLGILAFALGWEVIYQVGKWACAHYCAQWPKLASLGSSYLAAFINACVCSVAGLWICISLLSADDDARALIRDGDEYAMTTVAVLLAAHSFIGWLLMDIVHLITHFPDLGGTDMVIHHVCFILLACVGYGYRVLPLTGGWLLLGEVSSIFLQLRWYLINSGQGESPMLQWTNYAFAGCFFLFRVVVLWIGLFDLLLHLRPVLIAPPHNASAGAINALCVIVVACALLNLYWLFKIVRMATRPPRQLRDESPLVARKSRMHRSSSASSTSSLTAAEDLEIAVTPTTAAVSIGRFRD